MEVEVDLDTAIGSGDPAESGIAGGAELLAFAEAAVTGASLDGPRSALIASVGMDGAAQAAATVAAFSGLVRVADGTGIPIDEGLASASAEIRVQLDGFADERGDEAYNQKLSERRVQHVYTLLVAAGVDQDRIRVLAHGERQAADKTPDDFALQRKVSLKLYLEDEAHSFAANPTH